MVGVGAGRQRRSHRSDERRGGCCTDLEEFSRRATRQPSKHPSTPVPESHRSTRVAANQLGMYATGEDVPKYREKTIRLFKIAPQAPPFQAPPFQAPRPKAPPS